MPRTAFLSILTAAALSLMQPVASATRTRPVELTCPVCGSKASGVEVLSTNSFGGQDRDFFQRAAGGQLVLLTPVTCPACLFSGFLEDFRKEVPEDFKDLILKGALKPAPHRQRDKSDPALALFTEGDSPKTDFPAWVRHDLILQVLSLRAAEPRRLAIQALKVTWALRLEENPFNGLFLAAGKENEEWVEEATAGIEAQKNRALAEVARGSFLGKNLSGFPEEKRFAAAVFSAWYLRTHGENAELLKLWPSLKPFFPEKDRTPLEEALNKAIDLDRGYQKKCLEFLAKIEPAKEGSGDKAVATDLYVSGEVNRRLGENARAVEFFDKAAAVEGLEEWLATYLREQKAIAQAAMK